MTKSPICPTCDQPIRLDDHVYFWPDRLTMEHLSCRMLCLNIPAEMEVSANPVYGPMD